MRRPESLCRDMGPVPRPAVRSRRSHGRVTTIRHEKRAPEDALVRLLFRAPWYRHPRWRAMVSEASPPTTRPSGTVVRTERVLSDPSGKTCNTGMASENGLRRGSVGPRSVGPRSVGMWRRIRIDSSAARCQACSHERATYPEPLVVVRLIRRPPFRAHSPHRGPPPGGGRPFFSSGIPFPPDRGIETSTQPSGWER